MAAITLFAEDVPMVTDALEVPKETSNMKMKKADLEELEDILEWLDGLDCTEKHEDTIELHQPDTCAWLLETYAYKSWRHGKDSFLWLHGKPGAGKSVLTAFLIDKLESSLEVGEFLAFFYCDFRSERSAAAAEVMRSILCQLLRKFHSDAIHPGDILVDLTKEKRRGKSLLKNSNRLARFVSSAANQFARVPLVVIDALDECSDVDNLVDALVALSQAKLRLFTTSRSLQPIKDRFRNLPSLSLEEMSTSVSADIRLHVMRELDSDRHRRLRFVPPKLKGEIQSTLCENADGMFRWIQCQFETLKRCVTATDFRKTLENLPKGLDETYKQILLAINEEEQEAQVARRALTWLVAAFSRLRLTQIVEALSIDVDQRVLNPDLAPVHGVALLDVLSSLVTHNEETDIVILSHFSVREYLTGELVHAQVPGYPIDPQLAEGQLAQLCMCYIAACLNQRREFGGNSPTTHGSWIDSDSVEFRTAGPRSPVVSPPLESSPLFEYVMSYTFDHLGLVETGNKAILNALVALAADVQKKPLVWEQIRPKQEQPAWPTSQDDFVLYILVAFATVPLLRSFLSHSSLKPKTGTNPLVYAAYLDRVAHARVLLSRGASLSCSGLLALRRPLQVTPLEAAVIHKSSAVTNLFLMKGTPVPHRLCVRVLDPEFLSFAAGARVAARILQTDDFAEWAVKDLDRPPYLDMLSGWDYTHRQVTADVDLWPNDEDIVTILRRLVQVGCDPFTHQSFSQNVFHQATAAGHISTVKFMLSLGIPPPRDILLCVPCSLKRRSLPSSLMLSLLLDNGADLHAVTELEQSALHVAMDSQSMDYPEEDCLERVKVLIDAGCDPSARNLSGDTPLWLAASRGFRSVVQCMLSRGAPLPHDILLSVSGNSLKMASMVRYLLCRGADVFVAASDGNTALHHILDRSYHDHEGSEENCLETATMLVAAGCSPFISNSVGDTPMDIALRTGNISIVEYFLGLKVPLPHDALLKASSVEMLSANSATMINMLVSKRIDVSAVSPDGSNALHLVLARYITRHLEEVVKLLVEVGCDATVHNTAGQTPMHIAARYRHKPIVVYFLSQRVPLPHDIMCARANGELFTFFLEQGADPHVLAKTGDSVLHGVMTYVSPESDALKLTKALIRAGCNPCMLNSAGESPLHVAVRRGYISVVEYVLSLKVSPLPSDILLTASRPQSPMYRSSGVQVIRFLIDKGAVTKVVTETGDSPLHLALSSHGRKHDSEELLNITKMLVDVGCELRAQNMAGETALHAAAKGGHLEVVEYLILQGVPVSPDILLAAAMANWPNHKPKIMRLLISKGADIRAVTANGDNALHLTLDCSYNATRLETAKVLVDSGCDASQPNLAGKTPLHVAVGSGHLPLVKYLRSQNVSLPFDILFAAAAALEKPRNPWQQPPNRYQMVSLLIRAGANVNVVAPNGDTLLHVAIRKRYKPRNPRTISWWFIEILLRHGCDPWVCNVDGQTAFDLAEEHGQINNFVRLVNTCRSSDQSQLSLELVERSSSKRQAEEMNLDVLAGQSTKRGRFVDMEEEDEMAEVDEELMV